MHSQIDPILIKEGAESYNIKGVGCTLNSQKNHRGKKQILSLKKKTVKSKQSTGSLRNHS